MANNAERWKIVYLNACWQYESLFSAATIRKRTLPVGFQDLLVWEYDPDDIAYLNWCIPDNWDGNLIWVKVYWNNGPGNTPGNLCTWAIGFNCFGDGHNLAAVGADYDQPDEVESVWTLSVAPEIGISPTYAGPNTPAAGYYITIRLGRRWFDPFGDNCDSIGIRIRYGIQ